jgi:hypothetical protein
VAIDTIAQIAIGAIDNAGGKVDAIYARNRRLYGIYGTDQRVSIQFADDPAVEAQQRSELAPLNPIRGEINGLIDGWRRSANAARKAKAKYFDRRVADALTLGLEKDVPAAGVALQAVKQDLEDDRVSIGRFRYLMVASGTCAVLIIFIMLYTSDWYGNLVGSFRKDTWPVLLGSASGAVGAFFSIAIGIRSRTVLTDLNWRDNTCDALLRILIGLIGAGLLMCLLKSQMIALSVGGATLSPDANGTISWPITVVAGFLAGFSERLIPDLLARAAISAQGPTKGANPPPLPGGQPPVGSSPPGGAHAPAAPSPPPPPPAPEDDSTSADCVCDLTITPEEVTSDADLPATAGGVETP